MYSQNKFIFKYATIEDEYPNDIIETADGGFIIAASIGTYPSPYRPLFIRLNSMGDTICTKCIVVENANCYINHFIKMDNGYILGVGEKKVGSNNTKIWLVTLDDFLTVIHDTSFATNLSFCYEVFSFLDHFHNLIIYGAACVTNQSPDPHPFVFKLSQTYDSLFFHYYSNPYGQYVYSMMENFDNTGYYMSNYGWMTSPEYTPSQFLTYNNLFNIISMDSVPDKLDLYMNMKKINSTQFLISGKRHLLNSNPRTDKVGVLKLDSSFNVNAKCYLGPEDTVTYPGYNTNLSFINVSDIFLGGTINQDWSELFSSSHSYILLGKLDSTLNIKWQKEYGGDTYYMVWSVSATTDGGCIVGASTNDYALQGEQRDIYILKVDSNGLVTGQNDLPPIKSYDAIVYPNPGSDKICVETQLRNAVFTLYDLTGRELLQSDLVPGRSSIPVQNLPSGMYIYNVMQNAEIKGCGKWKKE
jgi:hypothetical protein